MLTRGDLKDLVFAALVDLGGAGRVVDVARHIWVKHSADISSSGDLLFTWQYDMRWAANLLRHEGRIKPVADCPRGVWAVT